MGLVQKLVKKALKNLKTFLGTHHPKPKLISDSQIALCLMTKPAVTLTLGTGLLFARVQDTFGSGGKRSGLYYAPGSTLSTSVDLLTRYDPLLVDKISPEFYAPSFLKPWVEDHINTPVAKMKMLADKDIPHRNPTFLKYAIVPGGHSANLFTATSTQQPQQTKVQSSNSTQQAGEL